MGSLMRSDAPNKDLELKGWIGFTLQSNASLEMLRNTVNNDTLLKWLLFSPRQTGESIILDLASGEILHSSCKYGPKIHGSGICIFFLCSISKCQTFPLPSQ